MKNHSIAIYGLGVMGGSLAKNLLSRGCRVSLYSKSGEERDRFSASCTEGDMCSTQEEMLRGMAPPRVIFLMITAGSPVDQVLEELAPHLQKGDVVIDGGNSHYRDTGRRADSFRERGIHYLGVGVSGGEEGALKGPSLMAGGSREGWDNLQGNAPVHCGGGGRGALLRISGFRRCGPLCKNGTQRY